MALSPSTALGLVSRQEFGGEACVFEGGPDRWGSQGRGYWAAGSKWGQDMGKTYPLPARGEALNPKLPVLTLGLGCWTSEEMTFPFQCGDLFYGLGLACPLGCQQPPPSHIPEAQGLSKWAGGAV